MRKIFAAAAFCAFIKIFFAMPYTRKTYDMMAQKIFLMPPPPKRRYARADIRRYAAGEDAWYYFHDTLPLFGIANAAAAIFLLWGRRYFTPKDRYEDIFHFACVPLLQPRHAAAALPMPLHYCQAFSPAMLMPCAIFARARVVYFLDIWYFLFSDIIAFLRAIHIIFLLHEVSSPLIWYMRQKDTMIWWCCRL